MSLKGIILAGGVGSRLGPVTHAVSKHLLPVYNKPMIYYPLSTLMLADIRDILIISSPECLPFYEKLLGDGKQFGIKLRYAVQEEPRGVPDAYLIAEKIGFLQNEPSLLILGDNLFFGTGIGSVLEQLTQHKGGMAALAYAVIDPENYGVVSFDEDEKVVSIQEKPQKSHSPFALTGLYFCDAAAPKVAKGIATSLRGELEIVEMMKHYMKKDALHVHRLGRGFAWIDAGSFDRLLDASNFIATIERRQGLKIADLSEIAQRNGWI